MASKVVLVECGGEGGSDGAAVTAPVWPEPQETEEEFLIPECNGFLRKAFHQVPLVQRV